MLARIFDKFYPVVDESVNTVSIPMTWTRNDLRHEVVLMRTVVWFKPGMGKSLEVDELIGVEDY